MVTGSTPARAKAWKRARGVRPRAAAFSSLMMRTAEAPSVICEELPAVILPPSGLKAGLRPARTSSEVSGRMPSSAESSSSVSRPRRRGPATGTISFSNRPSAVARAACCWLRSDAAVEVLAGDAPLVGDHLGADALADQTARAPRSGPSSRGPKGKPNSRTTEEPMGVRVMLSTPAATTTS